MTLYTKGLRTTNKKVSLPKRFGTVNPTKDDYIKDLEYDNNCLYGMNSSIKEKCKVYEKELLERLQYKYSTENSNRMFQLLILIHAMYGTYRDNLILIKKNINKIRGLRNGTIKEI